MRQHHPSQHNLADATSGGPNNLCHGTRRACECRNRRTVTVLGQTHRRVRSHTPNICSCPSFKELWIMHCRWHQLNMWVPAGCKFNLRLAYVGACRLQVQLAVGNRCSTAIRVDPAAQHQMQKCQLKRWRQTCSQGQQQSKR
jgi:hypothetical protein